MSDTPMKKGPSLAEKRGGTRPALKMPWLGGNHGVDA